jgi:hypothetical protein
MPLSTALSKTAAEAAEGMVPWAVSAGGVCTVGAGGSTAVGDSGSTLGDRNRDGSRRPVWMVRFGVWVREGNGAEYREEGYNKSGEGRKVF